MGKLELLLGNLDVQYQCVADTIILEGQWHLRVNEKGRKVWLSSRNARPQLSGG